MSKMKKQILIHVSGPSGGGKTTMMKIISSKLTKIKKQNTLLVDTDEIDDRIILQLIQNPKYQKWFDNPNDKNKAKIGKIHSKFVREEFKKLLATGKNIVLFGISLGYIHDADYKYTIKIDPETCYKQSMLRTLNDITQNADKIRKVLKSNLSPEVIRTYCIHKFHLRHNFISGVSSLDTWREFYKEEAKAGYTALPFDNIIDKIIKLL
ncbi:Putative helicase [Pacmanvirus A23]|uniref:Putative helicase n=1 Tax=Pacmanvirus A23 TaxID=1932881 RepID=UPI000A092704|nr:Putative helicase [Pacmanvirus A23]SIP86155.1 Putative helicase [Pacmanvirus A23]